jgi:hypothetical protein
MHCWAFGSIEAVKKICCDWSWMASKKRHLLYLSSLRLSLDIKFQFRTKILELLAYKRIMSQIEWVIQECFY